MCLPRASGYCTRAELFRDYCFFFMSVVHGCHPLVHVYKWHCASCGVPPSSSGEVTSFREVEISAHGLLTVLGRYCWTGHCHKMLDAGQPSSQSAQPGETSRGNLQAVWHPSIRKRAEGKPYCPNPRMERGAVTSTWSPLVV